MPMKPFIIKSLRSNNSKRAYKVTTLTTIPSIRQSRTNLLARLWRSWNALTRTKSTMLRVCVITATTNMVEIVMLMLAPILIGLCMPKVNVKTATWMTITSKKEEWTKKSNNQKRQKTKTEYLWLIAFQNLSKALFNPKDRRFRLPLNNEIMFNW